MEGRSVEAYASLELSSTYLRNCEGGKAQSQHLPYALLYASLLTMLMRLYG